MSTSFEKNEMLGVVIGFYLSEIIERLEPCLHKRQHAHQREYRKDKKATTQPPPNTSDQPRRANTHIDLQRQTCPSHTSNEVGHTYECGSQGARSDQRGPAREVNAVGCKARSWPSCGQPGRRLPRANPSWKPCSPACGHQLRVPQGAWGAQTQ